MRPRLKETEPFLPFVSMDEILEFDPNRPETFTKSPVLNKVLEVAEKKQFHAATTIAEYLSLPERYLSGAIKIVTGYSIYEIIAERVLPKIYATIEANPGKSGDEIAKLLGYSDHSVIYRFLGRDEYNRLLNTRPYRFNKMGS